MFVWIIYYKSCTFIPFWTLDSVEGSYKFWSVHLSLSLCNTIFSGLAHYFFLILVYSLDPSEIAPYDRRINKWLNRTLLGFSTLVSLKNLLKIHKNCRNGVFFSWSLVKICLLDYFEIAPDDRHQNWVKSTVLDF